MRLRVLYILSVALFAACTPAAESQPPLPLSVTFLDQTWEWSDARLSSTAAAADWNAYLKANTRDGIELAGALAHIAERLALDDYGRLLLLRDFLAQIPLTDSQHPISFAQALRAGWNDDSRVAFAVAILRAQGIGAVAFSNGSEALIGLPVSEKNTFNAALQRMEASRRLFLVEQDIARTFLLWNLDGRMGKVDVKADEPPRLLADAADLFAVRDLRDVALESYAVPDNLRADRERRTFFLVDGSAVSYEVHPRVADWLATAPEHDFATQYRLERSEWHRTGLGKGLEALAGRYGEEQLISLLLQSVQRHFAYVEGPLRSIHEILGGREGDCDQLALILANMLSDLGYGGRDLVAILWETAGHLALGVQPRRDAPDKGAQFYVHEKATYYVLDPTYYHRRNGELVTRWGEMSPDNRAHVHDIVFLEHTL